MQEFAALRSKTPDHALVVPTFDYTKSDQSGSRWILVSDKKGNPAAFGAFKKLRITDLAELISSGKIWYDDPPFSRMNIQCDADFVSGNCFYRGGMYVYPGHRKSGLPWGIATYAQTIAALEGMDWIVGQAFEEIVERGIPVHTYGFETVELQSEYVGHCPLKGPLEGGKSALYLLTCSRAFFLNNIRVSSNILVPGSDKELVSAAFEFKMIHDTKKRARGAA